MRRPDESALRQHFDRVSRRNFLFSAAAACAGLMPVTNLPAQSLSGPKRSETVMIEAFSASGKSLGRMQIARIEKSDAEWRKQLSPDSFEVTRKAETERPFSGKYVNNHETGIYHCICCDTPVFDSHTKFESGTGWPSFWQPISRANIIELQDNSHNMRRIAVSCARCDAHLGHVFSDGPQPTGLRYCMNSVALHFVALM